METCSQSKLKNLVGDVASQKPVEICNANWALDWLPPQDLFNVDGVA